MTDDELSQLDTVELGELGSILPNLVDLESFSEGMILHQCKRRYLDNNIYTFVGVILVAMNPYKKLDIYGPRMIEKYRMSAAYGDEATQQPHVYSVSSLALQKLKSQLKSQSVLISGESGAGKTETTKKILEYLSAVAGSSSSSSNVAQQILRSNPILESFGNAKTERNNNSSRFGKWMELNFMSNGTIRGCRIINYLLEKSRVTCQLEGERNYHIFYMLTGDSNCKDSYMLDEASAYHYLNQR